MRFFLELIVELTNLPGLAKNLYRQRELIRTLAWRDYAARYRGSFGGALWSFLQPLIMMVIYAGFFLFPQG
jgi:lipopolysaccharide transport system permease protein